ncbi:MAG: permease-like cell division protein FtsX [Thermoanaerobaculia bacterium]|nr:permease-like cell division protein FtsX [Thermoanaerobaculia bacterium]
MTFLQALLYFTREASVNLIRGWKVSLLAILTITLSLFLTGSFFLVSSNLSQLTKTWRGESKVVVYFAPGTDSAARDRVRGEIAAAAWSGEVSEVSPEQAATRFRSAFPSLEDLLEGWGDEPLPASLEIQVDWSTVDGEAMRADLETLRTDPVVDMVDDDRDWLAQLETAVLLLRGLALVLGGVLLLTAVFTIASIIRLTAYLYHDEIAVQRLVGATEFFIRGPFYIEGLLQGLLGGTLAAASLALGHWLALRRGDGLLVSVLLERFLVPSQLLLLVTLGGLAGLFGAVASLRKESLGRTAEVPDGGWEEEV